MIITKNWTLWVHVIPKINRAKHFQSLKVLILLTLPSSYNHFCNTGRDSKAQLHIFSQLKVLILLTLLSSYNHFCNKDRDSKAINTYNYIKVTIKYTSNFWVFAYELRGCGFESRCCHLKKDLICLLLCFRSVATWILSIIDDFGTPTPNF